jgi:hypothetical protein
MAGREHTRRTVLAVTLAAACALALGACGDDGDDTEASGARDDEPTETTAAGAAGDGAEDGTGDAAAGLCKNLTEDELTGIIGEVVDATGRGGEPVFLRSDGSEFNYVVDGCTFEVAVPDDDEPHEYAIYTGTPPEGIDLYEEFEVGRRPEDMEPVDGLGERAFVDHTFGNQKVELIVDLGDGSALFVESQPPFGVPVADTPTLVALAELALGEG